MEPDLFRQRKEGKKQYRELSLEQRMWISGSRQKIIEQDRADRWGDCGRSVIEIGGYGLQTDPKGDRKGGG